MLTKALRLHEAIVSTWSPICSGAGLHLRQIAQPNSNIAAYEAHVMHPSCLQSQAVLLSYLRFADAVCLKEMKRAGAELLPLAGESKEVAQVPQRNQFVPGSQAAQEGSTPHTWYGVLV